MESQIVCGSCTEILPQLPSGCARLVFADPPFNIKYPYDIYSDDREHNEYVAWTNGWIKDCVRVLAPNGSMFVCIGSEYAAEMNFALKNAGLLQRDWIVWRYGFGVASKQKFQRCFTHILYFTKSQDFVFNADSIRVPSDRQIKYGDKRADPRGKIPSSVWDFPRLCGTFKARLKDENGKTAHPCQMHSGPVDRIIRVATNPGDLVIDPFCGSGTTAFVAKQLGRSFVTCDISTAYCRLSAQRIFGDNLYFKEYTGTKK